MANYGYTSGGSAGKAKSRFGIRLQPGGNAYSGVESTEGSNKVKPQSENVQTATCESATVLPITTGGWEPPSRAGWAAPPEVLTKATNNIETATNYLREPPDHWSLQSRPVSYGKTNGSATRKTIDSREAARKYGGTYIVY